MKSKHVWKSFSIRKFIIALFSLLIPVLFIGLVYSVIKSGFHYQLDIDEFFFSQGVYLYAHGYKPYLDVYASVYPPVFHWIMMPAFWLKGFTFDGIYTARIVMIVFLIIRLVCSWLIIKTVFSKRAAFIFLALFLFDPFAVFTTMQFRPDNLMLMLFTVGLLFFTYGLTQNQRKLLFISGFFFGFSILILTKVTPSLFALGSVFLIYSIVKHRMKDFLFFIFGGTIPILLFGLYLLSQGSLREMFVQMFIEGKLLYTNFTHQLPIYTMMRPNNIYVFGKMGKPITWVYIWLIIPLGVTGMYHAAHSILTNTRKTSKDIIQCILGLAFIAQWAVLFFIQVAFMQHYMPVHWLAVAFGAYAIDQLLVASYRYRIYSTLITVCFIGLYVALTLTSIYLNLARSLMVGNETRAMYENRWKQIPPEQAVFPGFLFRPPSYPIPYGGFIVNFPQVIISRLPSIVQVLETTKPPLLLDDYVLTKLPADAQAYISTHYTRVPGDGELMTRKP